jgi:hypothetical protein
MLKNIIYPDPIVFEEISAMFLRQALNQLCELFLI